MANNSPSISQVLVHVLLTVLTGGLWLVVLIIWHLLKK